jgi:hypothetical protein
MEESIQIAFNLMAAPFGLLALYYGYKGYHATKGGLKAYKYYFVAMISVGVVLFLDLLRLLKILDTLEFLMEFALFISAIFFMFAFKDLLEFLFEIR